MYPQLIIAFISIVYLVLIWRAFSTFNRIKEHLSLHHQEFYHGLSLNKKLSEIISGDPSVTYGMLQDLRWMFNSKLDLGDNYLNANKKFFCQQFTLAQAVFLTSFIGFAVFLVFKG